MFSNNIFASVSFPSGADVQRGDASAQRDDSGQVGFLCHRTVLEPPAALHLIPKNKRPERMRHGPGLFMTPEKGITLR